MQYRANDDGQKQGVFTVQNAAATPWLWDGTGLTDGSTFGQFVGGYGIEIDSTTPDSPPARSSWRRSRTCSARGSPRR